MNWIKEIRQRRLEEKKEYERLKNSSKDLSELVLEEIFSVNGIEVYFSQTTISPHSENFVGGNVSKYDSGYSSKSILIVSPEKVNVPTNKLVFYGNSSVRAGDIILARIPCNQLVRYHSLEDSFGERLFYLPRSLNLEEEAIVLEILSSDKKTIKKEFSATADKYKPR